MSVTRDSLAGTRVIFSGAVGRAGPHVRTDASRLAKIEPPTRVRLSRRATLAGAGAILAGGAGCIGGASDGLDEDGTVAVASFFTFSDFAREVADGTPVTVENLAPTGHHGHGWEPDPSISRSTLDAAADPPVEPDAIRVVRWSIYIGPRTIASERPVTMSSQHDGDSLVRLVLVVLAIIVLFPLLMMLFAMPMMGTMGWLGGGGPGTGFSPLWGIGMMLLFFLLILGIGYVLYRALAGSRLVGRDRALEELRSAYARGELSDEEFERRRQRLQRERE